MNSEMAGTLRQLITGRSVAALGTIHHRTPYVSMVPFALTRDGRGLIILVSGLAAHTRDMLASPEVSLMVMEPEENGEMAQSLARVTVQGRADPLSSDTKEAAEARDVYLARFPDAAMLFDLGDFRLFVIELLSVRFVGGFGQAVTLTPEEFAAVVSEER